MARLSRRKKIAISLLSSCVVALVVSEVALQVLAPRQTAYGPIYAPDPELDYRLLAGAKDPVGPGVINSRGLRDVERPLEKPAGLKRVLLLGDSFAFGVVPREQVFGAVLDRELGPDVEVVNAGVPGWTTWQQARWLRSDGMGYAPDAVVVAFFVGNDVLESFGERVRVVNGDLEVKEKRRPRSGLRKLLNRSRVYQLFKGLPEDLWLGLWGDSRRARSYHRIEHERLAMCDPAAKDTLEPAWVRVEQDLREIQAIAGAVPVVVLVIPDEYQVDAALREAVLRRYDMDGSGYQWDLPQRRLAALTAELGLPRVCMLEPMQERTRAGERLYVPLDSHWNAEGNALAGEALAQVEVLAALAGRATASPEATPGDGGR